MKLILTRTLMLFTAVLVLSGGLVTYAATTLFTQNFPSQTFATPSLVEGSSCTGGNLQLDSVGSNVPSFAGSAAQIMFDCSNAQQAFSTTGTTSTTVYATPTFTVPSGWSLGYAAVTYPLTRGCNGLAILYPVSGTLQALTGGTDYVYCLTSTSSSNFSSFSIAWTQ